MSPVRDHIGIPIIAFNGLWERGDTDTTPPDHFSSCNNIDFVAQSSFGTRAGINLSQTVLVPLSNIKRIYNYPTQIANTLIVLAYDDDAGMGYIYHVVNANTVYGPILSIAGMTDFAFQPYAGRGYISPFSSSLPTLNPPAGALLGTPVSGTGVDIGSHNYAVSFLSSNGETVPGSITTIIVPPLLADPTGTPLPIDAGPGANALTPGQTYKWLVTLSRPTGRASGETNISPLSAGFVAPAITHTINMSLSIGIDATLLVNVYRTIGGGSTFYLDSQNMPVSVFVNSPFGTISDALIVAQPTAPISNTTQAQKINLTSIPVSPPSNINLVSGRRIYRTAAGSLQLKLLATINDNSTTTYVDTALDSSLGALAPTVDTIFTGLNIVEKGLSGQFVYVYAGDGSHARLAAGSGLTGTMSVGFGAGHTDAGLKIFGIVSQTISGYNSPPTVLTPFTTNATNGVSFGAIPTSGDPNVVKRLLVASKSISVYNGNPDGYQLFFVPNAVINNNTDTFLNNISFYDAELLADASHLLRNYTSIPAGAVLSMYHNRLLVGATATDISLILVSQPGEPEAIDQLTGLIVVPLDGNPVTNAQEMRDVLYVFKRAKTWGYADNGGDPSSWPDILIDAALGTCVHGIATVLDSGSTSVDFLIVATYGGIYQFNGRFVTPELGWKISNYWNKLDRNSFGKIQIINAPIQKDLFSVLPNRQILIGNYSNGMDWKSIRWTPWSIRSGVNTVAIHNIDEIIFGADIF